MVEQKSKVLCRACNAENSPGRITCQKCGASIALMQVTDEPNIVCPRCQKTNNAGSFFCYYCGKYFSDIAETKTRSSSKKPRRDSKQHPAQKARVVMPGGSEITLTGIPVFIERSDFDSTLPHDILMSVSRQHVLITYSRGKYYLKDYGREGKGSTNHTKLNGVDIYGKGNKALKDGDTVELAGQSELTMKFRLLEESK